MIGALKALFETKTDESPEDLHHRLHLAAAALLMECARADFTLDGVEQEELERVLVDTLEVSAADLQSLVVDAEQHVDESTSLYQFTRVVNDHYSAEQKNRLIGAMWRVAYVDGRIDKYEEHLIRQVAELIYVSHADYIRLKLEAAAAQ